MSPRRAWSREGSASDSIGSPGPTTPSSVSGSAASEFRTPLINVTGSDVALELPSRFLLGEYEASRDDDKLVTRLAGHQPQQLSSFANSKLFRSPPGSSARATGSAPSWTTGAKSGKMSGEQGSDTGSHDAEPRSIRRARGGAAVIQSPAPQSRSTASRNLAAGFTDGARVPGTTTVPVAHPEAADPREDGFNHLVYSPLPLDASVFSQTSQADRLLYDTSDLDQTTVAPAIDDVPSMSDGSSNRPSTGAPTSLASAVSGAHTFDPDRSEPPPPPHQLRYECFAYFLDCSAGPFDDIIEWDMHCRWHFKQAGPPVLGSKCPCCAFEARKDMLADFGLTALSTRYLDRARRDAARKNLTAYQADPAFAHQANILWKIRQMHVAVHFERGWSNASAEPAFEMFRYLRDRELISEATFKELEGVPRDEGEQGPQIYTSSAGRRGR